MITALRSIHVPRLCEDAGGDGVPSIPPERGNHIQTAGDIADEPFHLSSRSNTGSSTTSVQIDPNHASQPRLNARVSTCPANRARNGGSVTQTGEMDHVFGHSILLSIARRREKIFKDVLGVWTFLSCFAFCVWFGLVNSPLLRYNPANHPRCTDAVCGMDR